MVIVSSGDVQGTTRWRTLGLFLLEFFAGYLAARSLGRCHFGISRAAVVVVKVALSEPDIFPLISCWLM